MEYDKSFLREYSLDVARTKAGKSETSYKIDKTFFEKFDKSQVKEGDLKIDVNLDKTQSLIDARFQLHGWVYLDCDRCGSPYQQNIAKDFRIIFSFTEREGYEDAEVVFVDREEDQLSLIQEFYDFIHVSLTMRKDPDPEVHLCDPEVLRMLGLDEEGKPVENVKSDEEIDPRWAALKQLKDKLD